MMNLKSLFSPKNAISLLSLSMICMVLDSCHLGGKKGSGLSISGKESFADSAFSVVRLIKDGKGREVLEKDNTYYELVDFIDRTQLRKIMLKINKDQTTYLDSSISKSTFYIGATGIGDEKINWSIEGTGADIDYTNGVLVIHTEGRNSNEEDTYTQYSLLTGQKLMTYTYGQLMALIPNTSHKRFMGYLSQQSATVDRPEGFATVSYVGSDQVIDRVSIKVKGNNNTIPVYTPEIKMLVAKESGNTITGEGRTVILGHTDRNFTAKDLTNFAMQINYMLPNMTEPITVLIPVRDDHLDISSATYDKAIFELSMAK